MVTRRLIASQSHLHTHQVTQKKSKMRAPIRNFSNHQRILLRQKIWTHRLLKEHPAPYHPHKNTYYWKNRKNLDLASVAREKILVARSAVPTIKKLVRPLMQSKRGKRWRAVLHAMRAKVKTQIRWIQIKLKFCVNQRKETIASMMRTSWWLMKRNRQPSRAYRTS